LFIEFRHSLNTMTSGLDGTLKYSLTKNSHDVITEIMECINNISGK
jgi:hypothetical protein